MYSAKALAKYFMLTREYTALCEDMPLADLLKIAGTSNGNSKIGNVLNVSLPPVLTCGNCKECMHFCYDIKACLRFPKNVLLKRIANMVLLKRDRAAYFRMITDKLARRRKNFYFRWHQAGEIIDLEYLAEMVRIAKDFPHFTFWTYTKMYSIVNEYCSQNGGRPAVPENLHIMFSPWDGVKMDNPYNFPVFAVRLKAGNKDPFIWELMFKCPGNCDYCKDHNCGCLAGQDTYNDEH